MGACVHILLIISTYTMGVKNCVVSHSQLQPARTSRLPRSSAVRLEEEVCPVGASAAAGPVGSSTTEIRIQYWLLRNTTYQLNGESR